MKVQYAGDRGRYISEAHARTRVERRKARTFVVRVFGDQLRHEVSVKRDSASKEALLAAAGITKTGACTVLDVLPAPKDASASAHACGGVRREAQGLAAQTREHH